MDEKTIEKNFQRFARKEHTVPNVSYWGTKTRPAAAERGAGKRFTVKHTPNKSATSISGKSSSKDVDRHIEA